MNAAPSQTGGPTESGGGELFVGNYCVSFIDLLGQRAALRNQSLLIPPTSEEQQVVWIKTIRESIGAIASLQREAHQILTAATKGDRTGLRATLGAKDQALWDEMSTSRVTTQRWSDGLCSFCCLGDKQVKCQMNSVFKLFVLAGAHCFLGLARGQPVRGALEVAWGAELHPGELYGAVVARAYELESEVAGYPRIVIGQQLLKFIDLHCSTTATDPFTSYDRALAHICRGMIAVDDDSYAVLNYLGSGYRTITPPEIHSELYARARAFVHSQLRSHRESKNSKLAFRYVQLASFFEAYPPEHWAQ